MGIKWAAMAILVGFVGCANEGSRADVTPTEEGGRSGDDGASQVDGGMTFDPGNTTPSCAPGTKTSLSGTVYDPAGRVPLYNAVVYVPTAKLDALPSGVTCDRCGAKVSGAPHKTVLTGADGSFHLDDVPAGNVPLVIQIGKWRRQSVIPNVVACKDNAITNHDLTRLPNSQAEGDLPKLGVVSGAKDALECTLLRLGIKPSEFTPPTGIGRVHVFRGNGGAHLAGVDPTAMATGQSLWSDPAQLKNYDALLLDCEDGEAPETKAAQDKQNMVDYANLGGRVFTSHKSGNAWIEHGAAPFASTATWGIACCSDTATVDTMLPKGKAYAEWLFDVHASITQGELGMVEPLRSINGVNAGSSRWLYMADNQNVAQYSFNTPVGAAPEAQCGRVVFNNFHIIKATEDYGAGLDTDRVFPTGCKDRELPQNELALAFLFFDMSSCIQDDSKPPEPPK